MGEMRGGTGLRTGGGEVGDYGGNKMEIKREIAGDVMECSSMNRPCQMCYWRSLGKPLKQPSM